MQEQSIKRCPKCGETKPREAFSRDGRRPDGKQCWCKACVSAGGRDWVARNAERQKARVRAWQQAHPEKVRAASRAAYERDIADPVVVEQRRAAVKAWRLDNPERNRERKAVWNRENREHNREVERAWIAANPEKVRAKWTANTHRRRALKRAAFVENVDIRVLVTRDAGRCGICGKPVSPDQQSIDHIIPLSRGGDHSYRNVQLAHVACNSKKQARGPGQLRLFAEV